MQAAGLRLSPRSKVNVEVPADLLSPDPYPVSESVGSAAGQLETGKAGVSAASLSSVQSLSTVLCPGNISVGSAASQFEQFSEVSACSLSTALYPSVNAGSTAGQDKITKIKVIGIIEGERITLKKARSVLGTAQQSDIPAPGCVQFSDTPPSRDDLTVSADSCDTRAVASVAHPVTHPDSAVSIASSDRTQVRNSDSMLAPNADAHCLSPSLSAHHTALALPLPADAAHDLQDSTSSGIDLSLDSRRNLSVDNAESVSGLAFHGRGSSPDNDTVLFSLRLSKAVAWPSPP